jgi:predicted chitinase
VWYDNDAGTVAPPRILALARFGLPGDQPLIGDWDGDGRDALGVYRRTESGYHLQGVTDHAPFGPIYFGTPNVPGAVPLAGDWNGRDAVTIDDLVAIFGTNVDRATMAAHVPFLNAAMVTSGVVTPARKAAFFATVWNASGLRADAVEAGLARYRGRGLVRLTGAENYRRAGAYLDLDLVGQPDLAANPLVSAAVARWTWTVARNVNIAADRLDMAAVNIAIGDAPSRTEDAERCFVFTAAFMWFSGGIAPVGANCDLNLGAYFNALATRPPPATPATPPATPATPPVTPPPPPATAPPPTTTTVPPPTTTPATTPPSTTSTTATVPPTVGAGAP